MSDAISQILKEDYEGEKTYFKSLTNEELLNFLQGDFLTEELTRFKVIFNSGYLEELVLNTIYERDPILIQLCKDWEDFKNKQHTKIERRKKELIK